MTQRDIRAYLFDIVEACDLIAEFIDGKTLIDYVRTPLVRSAVERQTIIIGEALVQIGKLWPERMADFPEKSSIVGFRNYVVHGYFAIEHMQVWDIATMHVPPFRTAVAAMLDEMAS